MPPRGSEAAVASAPRAARAAGRSGGVPARPPRVCFVVNVDWFFLSHRLPLARAARDAGAEVTLIAADTGCGDRIRSEGLAFVPLPISRRGLNVFSEAAAVLALVRHYRRLRPDLVHHVTIKPVLYGSLAARAVGVPAVVNAISGLGYVFTSDDRSRLLRRVVNRVYRAALGNPRSRTILQNSDDLAMFVERGLLRRGQALVIRGSGVDCSAFRPVPEPPGEPVVMLPSRMLWDKGVGSFVEAARLLRGRGARARFVLVGASDDGNPTAVPHAQLEAWRDEGVVEWWGARDDMPAALAEAAVVVLPSRREGLPKVLLEAAACARPMVATDVPGCREVVRPGVNGLLVPPDDGPALADAVGRLLDAPAVRRDWGAAARDMAEREFAEEIVVARTMELYAALLGDLWPGAAAG